MKRFSIMLILALTAVLVYLFVIKINYEEIKQKFSQIEFQWIVIAGIFLLLSHWFRSLRWTMLLKQFQPNLKPELPFLALVISYSSNLLIPHSGIVTRAGFLRRKAQVPFSENLGTFIIEKIFDSIFVFFFAVFFIFKALKDFWVAYSVGFSSFIGYLLMGGIVLFILLQIAKKTLPDTLFQRCKHFYAKHRDSIMRGILSIKNMERPWKFMGYTVLSWIFYFGTFHVVFLAILPNFDLLTAVEIANVSYLAWISPTQAGMGAVHFAVAKTLTIKGFDVHFSSFAAIVLHGTITFFDLIFGLTAYTYALMVRSPD